MQINAKSKKTDINLKFDEFIKIQKNDIGADGKKEKTMTIEEDKDLWLEQLANLHSLVENSLKEYIESGDISIKKYPVILQEEQTGAYQADQLDINIGRQIVRLEPLGTFLIGARGRVDMIGPKGTVRLVIVPPKSDGPKIHFSISIGGNSVGSTSKSGSVSPREWVWKIATLPPKPTYFELNADSFRDALMGVVNGNF